MYSLEHSDLYSPPFKSSCAVVASCAALCDGQADDDAKHRVETAQPRPVTHRVESLGESLLVGR
jgi:hypothetical protein